MKTQPPTCRVSTAGEDVAEDVEEEEGALKLLVHFRLTAGGSAAGTGGASATDGLAKAVPAASSARMGLVSGCWLRRAARLRLRLGYSEDSPEIFSSVSKTRQCLLLGA